MKQQNNASPRKLFLAIDARVLIPVFTPVAKSLDSKIWEPIPEENLHLTLVPPFECNSSIPDIIRTITQATKLIAGDIYKLDQLIVGPDPKHPKVFCATGPASQTLETLATALRKAFLVPNKEPLKPHITFAYPKKRKIPSTLQPVPLQPHPILLISGITIYQGPSRPMYRMLGRAPLHMPDILDKKDSPVLV